MKDDSGMSDFSGIWDKLLGDRPPNGTAGARLYDEKIKIIRALPPGIAKGEKYAVLTKEQLEPRLSQARLKLNAGSYIKLIRFLIRGLVKGKKEYSWDVSIPALPIGLPREPARFTPLKFKELNNLRRLETVFIRSLSSGHELTPKQRLGQLLFSAILYGGLIDRQWLEPWLGSLCDRVRGDGSSLWLEMQRIWQYQRDPKDGTNGAKKRSAAKTIIISRRWFADPLTKSLIIRWQSDADTGKAFSGTLPNAYDLVKIFLIHAGSPKQDIPDNVARLLKMAETRLGLTVAPFLASYAAGSVKAVSLAPEVWVRLNSGRLLSRQPGPDSNEDLFVALKRGALNNEDLPAPLSDQELLLKKMRSIFASEAGIKKGNAELKNKMLAFEEKNNKQMCILLALLVKWACHLLARESQYKPATPKRYLSSIGNVLLIAFENENLLEMQCSDFIERYDRAVEMVKREKEKIYARQTISRFHDYLVKYFWVPRIHQGFFYRRSGPPESTVDANLLSHAEFDRLKQALGWSDTNRPRIATAALLAAIMGFRCGLRRNEVLFIRVRDIQWGSKPELVLRATAKRSLKTPNSTRRIPLYVLLPADELNELGSFLKEYRDQEQGKNDLVFSVQEKPGQALADAALFGPISETLTMVTGDKTLRFHHLRHSFATWLLVRLTGEGIGLRNSAPFLDHPEFEDKRVEDLRNAILANENLGRKGAYAVAMLCGHADLETTFTSYIHLCDWLLGREIGRPVALPQLSVEAVTGASGLSRATVYRSMKPGCDSKASEWDWDKLHRGAAIDSKYRDPFLDQTEEYTPKYFVFPEKPAAEPLWKTVQRALYLIQVRQKTVQDVSEIMEVPVEQIDKWISRVDQIIGMRHKYGTTYGLFRHVTARNRPLAKRLVTRKMDGLIVNWKRSRNRTGTGIFPKYPVEKADQKLAELILNNFEKLPEDRKNEVMIMVDYFLEIFSIHKGSLVFNVPRMAKHFLSVMRFLGIPETSIQLVEISGAAKGVGALARRREWEKSLGMKGCKWAFSDRGYGAKRKPGVIGFRVLSKVKDGMVREGSYGFRYAVYILAIGYWS